MYKRQAVDYISSLFDEIGIQGIEIEDNVPLTESETKGMFIDILPELPPDDGTARVSFYLDDDDDAEAILKEVDEGLSEPVSYTHLRMKNSQGAANGGSADHFLRFAAPF